MVSWHACCVMGARLSIFSCPVLGLVGLIDKWVVESVEKRCFVFPNLSIFLRVEMSFEAFGRLVKGKASPVFSQIQYP